MESVEWRYVVLNLELSCDELVESEIHITAGVGDSGDDRFNTIFSGF